MNTPAICGVAAIIAAAGCAHAQVCCDQILPPDQLLDLPDDGFVDANNDGIDGMACGPIFVATSGSDDAPGTIEAPMLTIGRAVLRAASFSPPRDVYVSSGLYEERLVLSSGVSIYGGYDAMNGWTRGIANNPLIRAGNYGVFAQQLDAPTTLDRLRFEANGSGILTADAVGLLSRDSTAALTISNCEFDVLGGTGGQFGQSGSGGSPGQDGQNGVPGPSGTGGSGAPGPFGTGGGNGGSAFTNSNGQTGTNAPGPLGGNGGTGGAGGTCANVPGNVNGSNGVNGTNGDAGLGGSAGTDLRGAGGAGSDGANGGGGGGGGAGGSLDNVLFPPCDGAGAGGGGGGGAGGTGGSGGTGGMPGQSSIAILAEPTAGVTVTNTIITTGDGGNGGPGGMGGVGGDGGTGALGGFGEDDAGNGGRGGHGADGGNGGQGGGGAGGSCISAVNVQSASVTLGAGVVNNLGTPGTGGTGGSIGQDGSTATLLSVPAYPFIPSDYDPTAAYVRIVTGVGTPGSAAPLVADPDLTDTHTFQILADGCCGTAQVIGGGIEYTPNPGFEGFDAFTFVATDNTGKSVDGIGFVRVGNPLVEDCNDNGIEDACDLESGFSTDSNNNGILDDCECDTDRDGDNDSDINDLLNYLASWFQGC